MMLKQWKLVGAMLASLFLVGLFLITGWSPTTRAQGGNSISVDCSAFTGGQVSSANNNITLAGTLGQWVISDPANGTGPVGTGFWPPAVEGCGKTISTVTR